MAGRPVDVLVNGEHQVWSNPEGWDNSKVDKHFKFLREKAPLPGQMGMTISRVKTWDEHAIELVVPQSPVGWGVLLGATAATLPLGAWGGVATRTGAVAGTSLVNRALVTGVARVGARVAAPVAGGLVGAGVERLGEEPEVATAYSKAALEGLFAGLAGEGGTLLLNTLSKVALGRVISHSRDPRALTEFLETLAPELQQTASGALPKSARGYAYIFEGDLQRAANQRMGDAVGEAVAQSTVRALHLPDLRQFLDDLGSPRFPTPTTFGPARSAFTPAEALEAYSVLAQAKATDFANLAGKATQSKIVLEHLRGHVLEDIQKQMGPQSTAALRKGMDSYATFNEVRRVLADDPTKIFPPNGGMQMAELQARVTERFMANPKARALMKNKLDDLVHLAWRGEKLPLGAGDVPAKIPFLRASGSRAVTAGAHEFPRLPTRAGGPLQLPGGFMDPAAAAVVQKLAEEYGVPTTYPERLRAPFR